MSKQNCLLGIDLGTTFLKASVFDRRTGHAIAHDLHPMQIASLTTTKPSSRLCMAPVGQTLVQAGSVQ